MFRIKKGFISGPKKSAFAKKNLFANISLENSDTSTLPR